MAPPVFGTAVAAGGPGTATEGTGTVAVPYPAGIVAGQLLQAVIVLEAAGLLPVELPAPSGWTKLVTDEYRDLGSSPRLRMAVFGRFAAGGEAGTVTFESGNGAGLRIQGAMHSVTMDRQRAGVPGVDGRVSDAGAGGADSLALTTHGADRLAFHAQYHSDDNFINGYTYPLSWTKRQDHWEQTGADGYLLISSRAMPAAATVASEAPSPLPGAVHRWAKLAWAIYDAVYPDWGGAVHRFGVSRRSARIRRPRTG